ncbi:MAG: 2-amino-4-hydroxy-6-hydroxymethyldihydropteridine diphosphokinase [Deltaproteobacteria bacterium]|nr:2-amino-4-hydroxy-6-hydroxymethyldihydropteridine diphosphokinase [Deltaproteobacteria bacterium]
MARAYLSIGANLGSRYETCKQAIALLDQVEGLTVTQVSCAWETEPVGLTDQPQFINLAVGIDSALSVHDLHLACQEIEKKLGRKHIQRWGPRVIDLDILLQEDLVLNEDGLIIPHQRMHERRFVLAPLAELAPDLIHPQIKKTVGQLLRELGPDGPQVKKISNPEI